MPSPPPAELHPAPSSENELALWQAVCANAPLLAAAEKCNAADVAKVAQLRKKGSAPEVRLALALGIARQKASLKFPKDVAAQVVADPQAVEQASSWGVAKWKAERFKEAAGIPGTEGVSPSLQKPAIHPAIHEGETPSVPGIPAFKVFDLCCGAGFDTLALADAGLQVEACDLNPVRVWMAEQNTKHLPTAPVIRLADMASYADHPDLKNALLHIDPARRNESGRIFNLADYLPPPEVWAPLLKQAKGACVKLAPGVAHHELADFAKSLGVKWSTSFVSDNGKLVQGLLWTGVLAQLAPREAVLLKGDQVHTLSGSAGAPPMFDAWNGEPACLFEADDAIERAQVAGQLPALFDLHPGLGLLAGAPMEPSPWLTAFTVLESFVWDEKRAKTMLKNHDAGLVEVKTRGQACDPNVLEKKFRGKGTRRLTLFVLRLGGSLRGYVTQRM